MANIYSKLADLIEKHPKRVILTWIVIVLLALPLGVLTMTQPGVLQYDMASMAGGDSESVQGINIIADTNYFSGGSASMDPIIVLEVPERPESGSVVDTDVDKFISNLHSLLSAKYGKDLFSTAESMNMGFYNKGDNVNGIIMLALSFSTNVDVNKQIPEIRDMVSKAKEGLSTDYGTYVTGSSAIGFDTEDASMTDIKRIDPFSILLVLILIGLFFRSFVSAATPPCVIGFAYAMTLAVIYGLSQFMGIYYMTSTIVLIAMLGAGCDYCIFILSRYREERALGKDHNASLREAIIWAGESITTSGISVIIGFGAMSLCSFAMIKTMGIILAVGIVFALLAALTLIPAIIAVVGDKIFYPNKSMKLDPAGKTMNSWYGSIVRFGHRYFRSSAEHATKYAVPIVLAAVLVTLPLGYVALNNEGSFDMISTMPTSESKDGVNVITENAFGGFIMPTYVLLEVDSDRPMYNVSSFDVSVDGEVVSIPQLDWTNFGTKYTNESTKLMLSIWNSDGSLESMFFEEGVNGNIAYVGGAIEMREMVEMAMFIIPGDGPLKEKREQALDLMTSVFPESLRNAVWEMYYLHDMHPELLDWQQFCKAADFIVNTGVGTVSNVYDGKQYIRMTVVVKDEPMSDLSMETVHLVRAAVENYMAKGGSEFFTSTYVTGTVAVIDDMSVSINKDFRFIEILVILMIALLLFFVMKSYFTPIRSIVTIVMSVIWTLGLTFIVFQELLSTPVSFIMPIILFVICLGLGMDYDILLTTRIRENVSKGMSNDKAIKEAIVKSGSIITLCGIIMAGAFGTMMLSTSPMLQEIGFALCFAIAVDALLIRTYVVPAMMHLMGKWNWVGPRWMSRGGVSLSEVLESANDDGTLDPYDEYLDCDTGYRFSTKLKVGMFGIGASVAFLLGFLISWVIMGAPSLTSIAFLDLITEPGAAGLISLIAMLACAVFLFLAGLSAVNCLEGTTRISGYLMGAASLVIVASIFIARSEAWGVAFLLVALTSLAMFFPTDERDSVIQGIIATVTVIAMPLVYFNGTFYVTLLLSLLSMASLLATSVFLVMRNRP